MPVIIGTNSQKPSDAEIHMYAVLALVEKKQKHSFTQTILHDLLCFLIMTSFTLKSSLVISFILLASAIAMVICLLHAESENLRIIQTQLLDLERNSPEEVLNDIVNVPEDQ